MELNPFVAVAKVRSPIVDPEKFSTLSRLLRVTAWIQRFIAVIFRRQVAAASLTVEEVDDALLYWIHHIQLDYFSEEISVLTKGKPLPSTSPLLPLQPFLENCLLRVGGRLNRAPIPYESRHQITL